MLHRSNGKYILLFGLPRWVFKTHLVCLITFCLGKFLEALVSCETQSRGIRQERRMECLLFLFKTKAIPLETSSDAIVRFREIERSSRILVHLHSLRFKCCCFYLSFSTIASRISLWGLITYSSVWLLQSLPLLFFPFSFFSGWPTAATETYSLTTVGWVRLSASFLAPQMLHLVWRLKVNWPRTMGRKSFL